ncbi:hypothetical protein SeMB42_g02279 [Synchytrium endobioticum]|uniref:AB hydrolase-1 domain-containing protein n=1 Tax=Synchytrium endobioticum TaxID=286115 RepID=A0A507DHJ7_9FUNG|nr:hypothetical protein SeLEV6574_g05342 [Synchytrium endobioticum]TPX50378.1 hypothetical protein SeMB42_g02279 [Synchytrium endobioticum]
MPLRVAQLSIPVPSGITLRAKAWGNPPANDAEAAAKAIIAAHGWLDNAGSYDLIAPMLAARGAYMVCLDLAGHGRSDHRPANMDYVLWDDVDDLLGVLDHFAWPQANILGHSMGGHIALIFAGTFPARVSRLTVIESLGPCVRFQDDAGALRAHIIRRRALAAGRPKPLYDSIHAACLARTDGLTKVSMDAARRLAVRGLTRGAERNHDVAVAGCGAVSDDIADVLSEGNGSTTTRYTWSTDKRLTLRPFLRWGDDALKNFLTSITAPTQMIFGLQTSLWDLKGEFCMNRFSWFGDRLRKDVMPGTHHLHLEADTAEAVGDAIIDFLELK